MQVIDHILVVNGAPGGIRGDEEVRSQIVSSKRRDALKSENKLITMNSMNSVTISDTLDILNYQNELPRRMNSRNIVAIRSQSSTIKDETANLSQMKSCTPSKVMKELHLFSEEEVPTQLNIIQDKGYRGFDPDFVLCKVFGYK